MDGRGKKTGDSQLRMLCVILALLVIAALAVVFFKMRGLQAEARRAAAEKESIVAENGSLAAENQSLAEENAALAAVNESREEELSGKPGADGGAREDDGLHNAEESGVEGSESGRTPDGATAESGGSESGQAPESDAAESAAGESAPKLETLDGVAAGTEVSPEELDTDHMEKYFKAYEMKKTGAVYGRISGRSYRENPDVALSDLRYLKVLHYNFNHQRQVGELIVNKGLAEEVLEIFRELYDAEYEIRSMHLIDDYWTGDGETSDSASIDKNNTSAFNYRPVTGGTKLSNHAYGFAIDINPQQNPYVSYRDGKARWEHENADDYIARDTGLAHVITHEDLAYRLFKEHGFTWGGDWNTPKDYQHFEKKLY